MLALATVIAAMIVIWKACDYFEAGSSHVGHALPPGVRGATINAIGSSLPELLTTTCLLFLFRDQDGFSAGIATCAGSAVFNGVIIPAVVILAVTWRKGHSGIVLTRSVVLRDGLFFIGAELVLISFLSVSVLQWWMGLALMGVYALYFGFMMLQVVQAKNETRLTKIEELLETKDFQGPLSWLRSFLNNNDDSNDADDMTTAKAWRYLILSTIVIGGACYGLSWAVIDLARLWDVPVFLTAVVFGAAATSVPDTVLSLKDALKGEYDDAVANAVGSNIFDITICLGLPLLCYGLVYGPVTLSAAVGSPANVQVLRIGLVVVSVIVVGLFLVRKRLTPVDGFGLLALFAGWLGFLTTLT